MKNKKSNTASGLEKTSTIIAKAAGSSAAFVIAFFVIIAWLISGPFFDFSNTWQLIINTTTTITTFLMVFLIQRSQNKDSLALHIKLNELLVAHEFASNRLVAVEDITEDELKSLQKFYKHIASMTEKEISIKESHSFNEAKKHHERSFNHKKNEMQK
jgi:low affinity Fe/Cu permease